jgi:hypothetical protein
VAEELSSESVAMRVIEEHAALHAEQDQWRTEVWQRIADYVMPRKSEINLKKTKSIDGFTDKVYDTTATHANTTLAAGQMDFMIGGKWFINKPPMPDASEEVQEWYRKTGEIMMEVIQETNFEMEIHSFFVMRGGFGTAHFHVEEDEDDIFYCKSEDIGTYVIAENAKGIVDKVMIVKEMSARQIMQEYDDKDFKGNKGVPPRIKDLIGTKDEIITVIEPRPVKERDPDKIDPLNMPIRTLHVCKEDKMVLREWGYPEMPTFVSRFLEWSDEVYGYCPSVEVLPAIRQANFIEESQDTLAEVKANPRLLIPSNLEGDVDLRAGGATIYDEGMPNALPQEWLTNGSMEANQDRITFKRQQIDQAFFTDLFQLLTSMSERSREKTAFEVQEMLAEKTGRFSPTFTRIKQELFKPLLTRIFSICFRRGLFPQPPEGAIVQNNLGEQLIDTPKVEFTSKIAMLLKARANNDFTTWMQMNIPLIEMQPDAFTRTVNVDRALATSADNQGVQSDFLNTIKEREAIQQSQQEQAAQAAQMEAAERMAGAAGDLGKAPEKLQEAIEV